MSERACVPGATQPCAGPAVCSGAQICSADGMSWGRCDCGDVGGGGASDGGAANAGAAALGGANAAGGASGDAGGGAGGEDATGGGGASSGAGGASGAGASSAGGASGQSGAGGTGGTAIPPDCGDGALAPGEACDDGNDADADGCSRRCTVEAGYACTLQPIGDSISIPAVFRDFREGGDFGRPNDIEPTQGMVAGELDGEGKPVWVAGGGVTSQDTFAEWYRDVPGTNSTTAGTITLFDDGAGGYVNRYGVNGERVQDIQRVECTCGNTDQPDHDAAGNPIPCTSCYLDEDPSTPGCDPPVTNDCSPGGRCENYTECVIDGNSYKAQVETVLAEWDGNPLFFPIDGDPFTPESERQAALFAPGYGDDWATTPGTHNFHFTSEIRFWFRYSASENYVLDFTGDDDVWVFIDGTLVADVGGVHSPVNAHLAMTGGAFTTTYALTEAGAVPAPLTGELALEDGGVYEVAVFHAERAVVVSSFKLTLSGFASARSACRPI